MTKQQTIVEDGGKLYKDYVPVSILALVFPVMIAFVGSYFMAQGNTAKIEVLQNNRQKFDIRLSDRISKLGEDTQRMALLLERTSVQMESVKEVVQEVRAEQLRLSREGGNMNKQQYFERKNP